MKIVAIKGSPHRRGSSNLLAEQFIRGAREAVHSVEELDVAHMDIHPCLGCEHCGMNGPCAQKDDVPKIRDALLGADMAVFVTPVYYFGMSAQLKMVIDRFYSYHMWDYHTPMEVIMEGLHNAVQTGKARFIGISNCFAWQLAKANFYAREHGLSEFISIQGHYEDLK